jgi:hypothetical protein
MTKPATTAGLSLLACGVATAAFAETITFDADRVGALPAAWTAGVTGRGAFRWAVEADASAPSAPNVLKQSGRGDFPWCVRRDVAIADGYVEVKFGRRITIKYVEAPVAKARWHLLRVEFAGSRIAVALDGKRYIEQEDAHIGGAGAVGVWTKADSVTVFDDFSYGGAGK